MYRSFRSSQSAGSVLPQEDAIERSLCWKADFGQESPVTKNFYREVGNHGYVDSLVSGVSLFFPSDNLLLIDTGGGITKLKITSIHLPTHFMVNTLLQMETPQPKRSSYMQSSITPNTIKHKHTPRLVFPHTAASVNLEATSPHELPPPSLLVSGRLSGSYHKIHSSGPTKGKWISWNPGMVIRIIIVVFIGDTIMGKIGINTVYSRHAHRVFRRLMVYCSALLGLKTKKRATGNLSGTSTMFPLCVHRNRQAPDQ